MANDYFVNASDMVEVADAIRSRTGNTDLLEFPYGISTAIFCIRADDSDKARKVIDTLVAEVGYLEKASNAQLDDKKANAGSNNYTKYARDLDAIKGFYNGNKQGYDWCEVFVDWGFVQAYGVETAKTLLCQPSESLGASARYSSQYYRNKGQFHTADPKAGDQIFFGTSGAETHTGIVIGVTGTTVYTVEGNTAPQTGVVENGGGVYAKKYALTDERIVGYGRPKYDEVIPEQGEQSKMPLDYVAWDGKTYRDIFLTGNKVTTGNAITDTTNADWSSTVSKPKLTTEHFNTGPSSWDCSGTASIQMYKYIEGLTAGDQLYLACKRKLAAYTAGTWLGVAAYEPDNNTPKITTTVNASNVSTTFQTVSGTYAVASEKSNVYIGSGGGAKLTGYVDDVVCIDLTELFGDNIPSMDEMDKLYENFLLLYNIENAN